MRIILALCLLFGFISPVAAKDINLDIDITQAEKLLSIACSNTPIDEREWASSPILQQQLEHHQQFGERFSFENYVAGLRSIARCEAPSPDPFRFAGLVTKRDEMRKAITYLSTHRQRLTAEVEDRLKPYVPQDFTYTGQVVLAGASFSCGGFEKGGIFFVDIPCLAGDIIAEYDAAVRLIAHETYHAIQRQFAYDRIEGPDGITTMAGAYDYMFQRLALEGTATHIGDMRDISGTGRYSKFSRSLARRNYRHLSYNFRLFDYMIEAIANQPEEISGRFPDIYGLAFDGAFGEHSYYVGQQMAAEIAHSHGPQAISCLLKLPFENYLLAYDAALQAGNNLDDSTAFSASTLDIAQKRLAVRNLPEDYRSCLSQ